MKTSKTTLEFLKKIFLIFTFLISYSAISYCQVLFRFDSDTDYSVSKYEYGQNRIEISFPYSRICSGITNHIKFQSTNPDLEMTISGNLIKPTLIKGFFIKACG